MSHLGDQDPIYKVTIQGPKLKLGIKILFSHPAPILIKKVWRHGNYILNLDNADMLQTGLVYPHTYCIGYGFPLTTSIG